MAYSGGRLLHPGEIDGGRDSVLVVDDIRPSRSSDQALVTRLYPGKHARSVPRNDRRLDISVAIEHVAQDLLQPGERRLSGNVVGRTNLFLRDQREMPCAPSLACGGRSP